MKFRLLTILFVLLGAVTSYAQKPLEPIILGDERLPEYIHLLQGKRVGVLTNHTAIIDSIHLVDTLLKSGVDVKRIFTPEDGFRGDGMGRHHDSYSGIEVVALDQEPKANDVFGCDVVVFDIQCIGVGECSALVSLMRMMQVCADIGVQFVILDRPNPFGNVVDGPIVEPQLRGKSGLSLPLMYGMTLGEVARMVNGEGWLRGGAKCRLIVVPCLGYGNYVLSENTEVIAAGLCMDIPIVSNNSIDLTQIVEAHRLRADNEEFFVSEDFDKQIGANYVREMIVLGYSAEEIEQVWRDDVERFVVKRKPYLIYED